MPVFGKEDMELVEAESSLGEDGRIGPLVTSRLAASEHVALPFCVAAFVKLLPLPSLATSSSYIRYLQNTNIPNFNTCISIK